MKNRVYFGGIIGCIACAVVIWSCGVAMILNSWLDLAWKILLTAAMLLVPFGIAIAITED